MEPTLSITEIFDAISAHCLECGWSAFDHEAPGGLCPDCGAKVITSDKPAIWELKAGAEFSYRGVKYTRTKALSGRGKDVSGREWAFSLLSWPDYIEGGQAIDPVLTDTFKIPVPAGAILVDGE